MRKSAPIQSTESGWLRAIAERSGTEESTAKSVLQKYNIQPQPTPPRAKSLRFKSIRVAGARAESDCDGTSSNNHNVYVFYTVLLFIRHIKMTVPEH